MTLDDYPIDKDYIDPPEPEEIEPVEEERTQEEIDKTHTFLSGEQAETAEIQWDRMAIEQNDGRGDHATMFYGKDAATPDERERYERLASVNEGMRESGREHKSKSNVVDKANFAKTCCSALEMTGFQQERVVWLTERVNVNMFGHYSYEHIILALISIVANEDGRWIRDEPKFQDMMVANEIDLLQIRRLRIMMKEDRRWNTEHSPL